MKRPSVKRTIDFLKEKLTPEELLELYCIIDNDPPAGIFYCKLGDVVRKLFPKEFAIENEKQEIK